VQIADQRLDLLQCMPAAERSEAAGSASLPSAACRHKAPCRPSVLLFRRIWDTLIHDINEMLKVATALAAGRGRYNELDPCLAFLKADRAVCRTGDARCFSARIYNPMRLRTSAGLTLTIAMPVTAAEATVRWDLRLDGRAFHDVEFIANRDDVAVTVDGRPCETPSLERRCVASAGHDYLFTALSIGLPGRSRAAHRLEVFQRRAADV